MLIIISLQFYSYIVKWISEKIHLQDFINYINHSNIVDLNLKKKLIIFLV